ncbi:MAG: RDD family protein [Myxococcaceae bacterium]|nr:RDD family protein [Myxococcaceae bacterium]MCI0669839.1 RDD family protein [Myxococcaceae bacterium]
MSKCIQCGATLPPVGECAVCQARGGKARPTPALLDLELKLDRRLPQRASGTAQDAPGQRPPSQMTALSEPLGLRPEPTLSGMFPRATRVPVQPPAPGTAAAQAPTAPAAPVAASSRVPPPLVPPQHASARPAPAAPPPPRAMAGGAQLPAAPPVVASAQHATPTQPPSQPGPGMPAAPAPTAPAVLHARPAALWRRALAGVVDGLLVLGVATLYLLAASAFIGVKLQRSASSLDALMEHAHALEPALLPGFILMMVLAMAYAGWGALSGGRTLGRRLVGIRLVDARGLTPSPTRAVVRAALSGASFLLFFAGFWMALFDRKGQTLHDKLTSTFLIHPG